MKRLVVQEHRSSQNFSIGNQNKSINSTNELLCRPENQVSHVGENGPGGIRTKLLITDDINSG